MPKAGSNPYTASTSSVASIKPTTPSQPTSLDGAINNALKELQRQLLWVCGTAIFPKVEELSQAKLQEIRGFVDTHYIEKAKGFDSAISAQNRKTAYARSVEIARSKTFSPMLVFLKNVYMTFEVGSVDQRKQAALNTLLLRGKNTLADAIACLAISQYVGERKLLTPQPQPKGEVEGFEDDPQKLKEIAEGFAAQIEDPKERRIVEGFIAKGAVRGYTKKEAEEEEAAASRAVDSFFRDLGNEFQAMVDRQNGAPASSSTSVKSTTPSPPAVDPVQAIMQTLQSEIFGLFGTTVFPQVDQLTKDQIANIKAIVDRYKTYGEPSVRPGSVQERNEAYLQGRRLISGDFKGLFSFLGRVLVSLDPQRQKEIRAGLIDKEGSLVYAIACLALSQGGGSKPTPARPKSEVAREKEEASRNYDEAFREFGKGIHAINEEADRSFNTFLSKLGGDIKEIMKGKEPIASISPVQTTQPSPATSVQNIMQALQSQILTICGTAAFPQATQLSASQLSQVNAFVEQQKDGARSVASQVPADARKAAYLRVVELAKVAPGKQMFAFLADCFKTEFPDRKQELRTHLGTGLFCLADSIACIAISQTGGGKPSNATVPAQKSVTAETSAARIAVNVFLEKLDADVEEIANRRRDTIDVSIDEAVQRSNARIQKMLDQQKK